MSAEEPTTRAEETRRPSINPVTAALAGTLSAVGAAWMVAGVFRDWTAHPVAVLGVALGSGVVFASSRWRRIANAQYLLGPIAAAVGAILVAPDVRGGATVPGLIEEAVRAGGLLQPPISFDPGWRFVLVVVFALLAGAASALAISLRRPKLGAALPVPLTMAAALIQPSSSEMANAAVSLVCVVLGLTFAYGSELGGAGQTASAFELRRLARGATIAVGLALAVMVISQAGFLFPQPEHQHVIPPQKPPPPPPEPDRVLFTYTANQPLLPLRLGVIDTYDAAQKAWLLPSYDATRLQRLQPPTRVPGAPRRPVAGSVTVTFTIVDATGHALPAIAGLEQVRGTRAVVSYDPLTQAISLADRPVFSGLRYTVVGQALPTAKELAQVPIAPRTMAHWLQVPEPPNEVVALLASCAGQAAKAGIPNDAFDRVQCLRSGLYSKVVAAGAGSPVDVPAARVAAMLDGGEASPYEITAAEALLARWAGVPSRIGYGYYRGTPQKDGSYAVHPVHGAMWLEVWFQGYGWVPLVGVPPRAKPSTSQQQKNQLQILATNQIQLFLYTPVRNPSITLLFVYVRWWVERILPVVLALVLLIVAYPWLFKVLRTRRRRRWSAGLGPEPRIAVAYAEFRDRARDLTIGDPAATPMQFLDAITDDAEHEELAWLVTRALWGDLARDLQPEDAVLAEQLARSVSRRLDRGQPAINRVLARTARTSLREPFSSDVPNFWVELELALKVPSRAGRALRAGAWPRARLRATTGAALSALSVALVLVLTLSCGPVHPLAALHRTLDRALVPRSLGAFSFSEEAKAERQYRTGPDSLISAGLVYTIHHQDATDGAVEEELFKPDVDVADINDEWVFAHCTASPEDCPGHEVLVGVEKNLGSGRFHRLYYRDQRAYVMDLPDQRIYVWFPAGKETLMILDLISQFTSGGAADAMFHGILDYERGRPAAPVPVPSIPPAVPPSPPAYGPAGAAPAS